MSLEDYWCDGKVSATISRFIYLLEIGGTFGVIWTWLTGSWTTATVSLVSMAVLLFNGPARFERSVDGVEP